WFEKIRQYKAKHPDLADHLERMQKRQLPQGWDRNLPTFPAFGPDKKDPTRTVPQAVASRDSSGEGLNVVAQNVPWLIGGSADLAPWTKPLLKSPGAGSFEADDYHGRNLHFGIREHAMGAILNGLSLCKVRPYGATFLIFSDYMRPPIRLSAIMEIPVIFI